MPTQGKYRELTSTSNCTTYQARRLNTRERDPNGSGTRAVATLNGTLGTTRWLVAILENHQQPDGSVARARGAAPLPRPATSSRRSPDSPLEERLTPAPFSIERAIRPDGCRRIALSIGQGVRMAA